MKDQLPHRVEQGGLLLGAPSLLQQLLDCLEREGPKALPGCVHPNGLWLPCLPPLHTPVVVMLTRAGQVGMHGGDWLCWQHGPLFQVGHQKPGQLGGRGAVEGQCPEGVPNLGLVLPQGPGQACT
eukprot:9908526-Lingulodinium_polyedra.AAC.1